MSKFFTTENFKKTVVEKTVEKNWRQRNLRRDENLEIRCGKVAKIANKKQTPQNCYFFIN